MFLVYQDTNILKMCHVGKMVQSLQAPSCKENITIYYRALSNELSTILSLKI